MKLSIINEMAVSSGAIAAFPVALGDKQTIVPLNKRDEEGYNKITRPGVNPQKNTTDNTSPNLDATLPQPKKSILKFKQKK